LKWINCVQLELDGTDYLEVVKQKPNIRSASDIILDISLNLVNTLKHLYWYHMDTYDNQIFNQIITNNPGLTTLIASLYFFDSTIFKNISTNSNLTKLIIPGYGDSLVINNIQLYKLPNIKTLEFQDKFSSVSATLDLLIDNCPNLEELILSYNHEYRQYIINYIMKLSNLKTLIIDSDGYKFSFLDSPLPQSNLEKLKIESISPMSLNFNNFVNMKNLKFINNTHMPIKSNIDYQISVNEELNNWRIINYPTSTQYWKVK
jgi:hypothetical protein